jgi:hypothetical protein
MDVDGFWHVIERARKRGGAFLEDLEAELKDFKPDLLITFQEALNARISESKLGALWDAAELINGGADETGFEHFRAWLVSCGRDVFEATLRDHDSLPAVAVKKGKAKLEDLLFVAGSVYAERTGKGDFFDRVVRTDRELEGVRASSREELKRKLPKTVAAYG